MARNLTIHMLGLSIVSFAFAVGSTAAHSETTFRSHSPLHPLPMPLAGTLAPSPKRFVDPARGDDAGLGTEAAPYKTLAHALHQLKPGDTLFLRGGTYYEQIALSRSGTADSLITIASYPGELAVVDGGLREFFESPATSWEPLAGGAEGEYVSTKTFPHADARRAPTQFLPGSWEPMWGVEDDRPLALGNFGDSLLPLHGYRTVMDLRASNELWLNEKKDHENGIYCGPGLWFNRDTGRIHIRLAHQRLDGLGPAAYRGETDPRKLPLVIAVGFGNEVLRVTGIKHVQIRGLVFRGATGSPMISIYGSDNVDLDHVTVFGGFPALLVNASHDIHVKHSAFRGLAAPWTSRAHMKYRGTPSYQIVLQNNQPINENIEFAWCEFTDDHDCAFLRFAKNLQLHHSFVDNFNDDGLECGPKLRNHTIFIHENRIGATLGALQQHETDKDESPLDHAADSGVYVFRNVFDSRAGVYYGPPMKPDPTGAFLHAEGHLAGDHGSPTWPVIRFYHNTVLRKSPVSRDNYLFGLAVVGLARTERDVFNNIFVQMDGVPGVKFIAMPHAENLREGGNLLWGVQGGSELTGDPFAKFRASPLFVESRKYYEPGWTSEDRMANPNFLSLAADGSQQTDLRLRSTSPAVRAGLALPSQWPDPFRKPGTETSDIGAIPLEAQSWGVGVDGRIPLCGELPRKD